MLAVSCEEVRTRLSPQPWPGIKKMRFEQLRAVCRAEGISDAGSHSEVKQRVIAHVRQKYITDGGSQDQDTTRTCPENASSAETVAGSDSSSTCAFFLKKKNRRCCNLSVNGRSYCRFHVELEAGCSRVKVACPLDPSHSVWEDRLEEHLKVCETARRQAAAKQRLQEESLRQPFYAYGINSRRADNDTDNRTDESGTVPALGYGPEALAWLRAARSSKDRLLGSVLPLVSLVDVDESPETVANPVESIDLDLEDVDSHHLSNADSNEGQARTGKRSELAMKHRLQELAVVAHLREIDLLKPDMAYLEFGAGSGGLGWAVRQAASPGKPAVVLIEKDEFPARTDRRWLEPAGGGDSPDATALAHKHHILKCKDQEMSCFYRARIDIRHLDASKLPFIAGRPVCAVAKHLCGVATDLTIAVILGQLHKNELQNPFAGSAIVTCCHGLMQWADYPEAGKRWLAKHCNAGREEFEMMKQCSGWAVDGGVHSHRYSKREQIREQRLSELHARAAEECIRGTPGPAASALEAEKDLIQASVSAHAWRSEVSEEERVAIGQSCKRLLDAGRREAFREAGLCCEIVRFIGEDVTPENTMLMAWSNPTVQLQLMQ